MDALSPARSVRVPSAPQSVLKHRSAAKGRARCSVAVLAEKHDNLDDSLSALPESLRERLRRRRQDGSPVRLWSCVQTAAHSTIRSIQTLLPLKMF